MSQLELTEGEKWDKVKAHLKKNKGKYLLGAAIAGLEGGGHLLQKSGLEGIGEKHLKAKEEFKNLHGKEFEDKKKEYAKSLRPDSMKVVIGDTIKPSSMARSLLGFSTRNERIINKAKDKLREVDPTAKIPYPIKK